MDTKDKLILLEKVREKIQKAVALAFGVDHVNVEITFHSSPVTLVYAAKELKYNPYLSDSTFWLNSPTEHGDITIFTNDRSMIKEEKARMKYENHKINSCS